MVLLANGNMYEVDSKTAKRILSDKALYRV